MFDLNKFICKNVTKRNESLFESEIKNNEGMLKSRINGKTVLVIGGAGSIGASFIKAILPYEPASLVVVDISENSLAELSRDLHSTEGLYVPDDYCPYPFSYSSEVFRKMFISRGGFDIVANFSAHKHVRSEKDLYSIEALLRNNIVDAKGLLDLLVKYPPEEYFCVSTDKAANPVNIMGASKRIMEDLIFSYSQFFPVKTARFANVAFSNGSLPAGFVSRLQKLQPISAPKDVRRYFVSPEESGQICMLACMLGNNREIYFPRLEENEMMSFDTIATSFLEEHGYKVKECASEEEARSEADKLSKESIYYPVYYSISDTSGEKPYEEFFTENETVDLTRYNSLGVIVDVNVPDKNRLNQFINKLNKLFESSDTNKEDIINVLDEYLGGFSHIEKGKSLDSKM